MSTPPAGESPPAPAGAPPAGAPAPAPSATTEGLGSLKILSVVFLSITVDDFKAELSPESRSLNFLITKSLWSTSGFTTELWK